MSKKQYTTSITQRFLQVCAEVIQEGHVNSRKEFAESVGEHQQNLSLMDKGTRAPTLEQIAKVCIKFGYNANWLILGTGNKKLGPEKKQAPTEERLNVLETAVAKLSRNMERIKPTTTETPKHKRLNGRTIKAVHRSGYRRP